MNKKISCPDIKTLQFAHKARALIRKLFDDQGFIEIETPYLLEANTPDPFIDPLWVTARSLPDRHFQLHTSPEIWLKKALGLGCEKIYHLARVFRDDPPGRHHSLEFSMLEWYRTEADLKALLIDCESIFAAVQNAALEIKIIDQRSPLTLITENLDDLFMRHADIDLPTILQKIAHGDGDLLQKEVLKKGDHLPTNANFSDTFFHIMLKYIEPNLPHDQPIAITRWPIQLAALSAPCADNENYCDRFEIYFRGLEIANAYQECIDPNVLRARFSRENSDRQNANKPTFPIDEEFLNSVSQMRKTAGIALGIDRLLLAIAKKKEISEIIFGFRDH